MKNMLQLQSMWCFLTLGVCLGSLLLPVEVFAVDRYVSTYGSNSFLACTPLGCTVNKNYCGDSSKPCGTLGWAALRSTSGDHIKVAAGEYVGTTQINGPSATGAFELTISGGWNEAFSSQDGAPTTTLNGNDDGTNSTLGVFPTLADLSLDISKIKIFNGTADDGGGLSIVPGASATANVSLDTCDIVSNVGKYGGGIYAKGGTTLNVANSLITNNINSIDGGGLSLRAYGRDINATLTNNYIVNNITGLLGGAVYLHAENGGTLTVNSVNNTISDNVNPAIPGAQIGGIAAVTNTPLKLGGTIVLNMTNDILWGNLDGDDSEMDLGLWTLGAGSSTTVNVEYSILGNVVVPSSAAVFNDQGNNQYQNPLFLSSANNNFHIQESSPAIDAGVCGKLVLANIGGQMVKVYKRIAPYDDFDGDPRPGVKIYAKCDVGADEIPDQDMDGVFDYNDAFPTDPAASVDSDGDGSPDSWNAGYTQADSTTGLKLDHYPDNPALSDKCANDFNAEGTSDVLFHNPANGRLLIWAMKNFSKSVHLPTHLSQDWNVVGKGDFNGDGTADVFYSHSIGATAIAEMDNAARSSLKFPGGLNPVWNVVAVGDFDGDGTDDILWRRSTDHTTMIWGFSNSSRTTIKFPGGLASAWQVVGTGDFDGDGTDDILYQHNSDGRLLVWKMDNLSRASVKLPRSLAAIWSVAGVGDFNDDGIDDVLYRKDSGATAIAEFSNLNRVALKFPGGANPVWSVKDIGDYNGDGTDDIFMRRSTDHITMIWGVSNSARNSVVMPGGLVSSWIVK